MWDEIALKIVKNVVPRLPVRPATARPVETAPAPAPRPADSPTLSDEMKALKRILIRKGLITEAEWQEVMGEIAGEKR